MGANMFCLTKDLSLEFKKRLKSGEIDPEKLALMTSAGRHDYFASFLGDANATQINSLFESKLLLKGQQQGMINWAKQSAGMKPQVRADLISKIGKMDRILNPTEEKAFLHDLASTKIGANVTLDEAKKLTDLSSKVQEAKKSLQEDINNTAKQIEYGSRIYDTQEYLNSINPNKGHIVANVLGIPRSLVAILDFVSAPFRHGFFAMSDPAWIKNYVKMPSLLLKKSAFRTQMGRIYGSKYYDALVKGGLSIFQTGGNLAKQEEQFASNLLNKFPLTGGSKRGYTGFLNGLRFDMAAAMMKAEELRGGDVGVGSKFVKDISTAVNNLTGAGSLGRFKSAAPEINLVFFSARMQIARINMLNPVTYLNPKTSARARVFMLKNLLGSLAISAGLLSLAKLAGAKVNITNPEKTDFGEISYGNLRIDTTGGNRVMITLLARLLTGRYVSAAGKVTQLGQGAYKPLTRMDLVQSFILGKLAPGAASIMGDFLTQVNGKDPWGNPVTVQDEAKKQVLPMNITNGMDMYNEDPTNTALGITLGLFGLPVSVSTPVNTKADWGDSTGKTLTQFHQAVGDAKFNAANDKFNTQYQSWYNKTTKTSAFKNLSADNQASLITSAKSTIEASVLKSYGFKYTPAKNDASTNYIIKSLKPK